MFAFLTRRSKPSRSKPRRTRLEVERLETRDCPTAPPGAPCITMSLTPMGGRLVQLSGHVTDQNPETVNITFSGVVTGNTYADASGDYSYLAEADALGAIFAQGVDEENLNSNPVSAYVDSASPTLTLEVTQMSGRMVTLSGLVTDEEPGGKFVAFSGVITGEAQTAADGTFSLTAEASGLGTVQAVTEDVWHLPSNMPTVDLFSSVPSLTLSIAYGAGHNVILSGQVTDEDAADRTVEILGVASGTVQTDAEGFFSIELTASQLGTIQARTTDPWLQMSEIVEVTAANVAPVILDFSGCEGPGRVWTFSGRVQDEHAEGLVIRFEGFPTIHGRTTTVDEEGNFFLTLQLNPGEGGGVSAETTDGWGLDSNLAETVIHQTS